MYVSNQEEIAVFILLDVLQHLFDEDDRWLS